jgi:hypothetical protein
MPRIRISEQQYKAILSHFKAHSSKMMNESNLIKESTKEVLLATTTILNNILGKKMSNYNKIIADKAISNPEVMKQVKTTFEDEFKLKEAVDNLSEMGIADVDNLLSTNAYKIVDEFNRITRSMGLNMSSNVAANLLELVPQKKKN